MTVKRAHKHEFKPHPTWSTHHYCTVCGFAAPTDTLVRAGILAAKPDRCSHSSGPGFCSLC